MIPLGVLGGARHASVGVTVEYQGTATSPGGMRYYTFKAMPIGTPTATRTVIVGLIWRSSSLTPSVTVGGITATLDQSARSGVQQVGLYRAEVPTGSTADVTAAFAGVPSLGVIAATWALDAHVAVVDAAGKTTTPLSLSMNTAAGGVALGMTGYNDRGTTDWTGPSERFNLYASATRGSGADMPTDGTPATVAATVTGVPSDPTLIAVTYRGV